MSEGKVLVVEDEPSFVEALTIGLEREGFEIAIAADGAEALQQFDRELELTVRHCKLSLQVMVHASENVSRLLFGKIPD